MMQVTVVIRAEGKTMMFDVFKTYRDGTKDEEEAADLIISGIKVTTDELAKAVQEWKEKREMDPR
jgi:hypothetical protein